jgi:hypothetical protein
LLPVQALGKKKAVLRILTPDLFDRFYESETHEVITESGDEEEYRRDPEVSSFYLLEFFERFAESLNSTNMSSSSKESVFYSAFTIPTLQLGLLSDGFAYKQCVLCHLVNQSYLYRPILLPFQFQKSVLVIFSTGASSGSKQHRSRYIQVQLQKQRLLDPPGHCSICRRRTRFRR